MQRASVVYLVFTVHGVRRMVQRKPTSLRAGERAIAIRVIYDTKLFEPPTLPQAEIAVTDGSYLHPAPPAVHVATVLREEVPLRPEAVDANDGQGGNTD